jgi:predicted lysophospholipase L1 biosynthesis ABC-type transport system permease subunit
VNEEFVRRFMNGGPALGRPVTFGFMSDVKPQTIVGVVADTRHNGLTGEVKPTFYRPHAQWAVSTGFPQRSVSLVVRTAGDAESLAGPVRSEIRSMDARLPVSSIQSMTEVLSRAVAQPRFTLVLLLAFGALALVLAIIGVYGVVSWAVAARRQELGVRMALGATPGAVVWLSLRQGLTYATIGIVAGGGTALIATRLMRGLVYEVPTTDPLTYATVVLGALVVSFCASWVPARRAAKTDPLAALRESSR